MCYLIRWPVGMVVAMVKDTPGNNTHTSPGTQIAHRLQDLILFLYTISTPATPTPSHPFHFCNAAHFLFFLNLFSALFFCIYFVSRSASPCAFLTFIILLILCHNSPCHHASPRKYLTQVKLATRHLTEAWRWEGSGWYGLPSTKRCKGAHRRCSPAWHQCRSRTTIATALDRWLERSVFTHLGECCEWVHSVALSHL